MRSSRAAHGRFGVHPDVVRLGVVSFLTDFSSEMIFSVFAVFFTTLASASSALLGLIEDRLAAGQRRGRRRDVTTAHARPQGTRSSAKGWEASYSPPCGRP